MRQFAKRQAGPVLDDAGVRELLITQRDHGGVDVRAAADWYGVGPEAIRRVLRRETWRHVKIGEAVSEAEVNAAQTRLLEALGKTPEAVAAQGEAIIEELGGPSMSPGAKALLAQLRGRPAGGTETPPDSGNQSPEGGV